MAFSDFMNKMPFTRRLMEGMQPPAAPAPTGAGPNPTSAQPGMTTDPAVDQDDSIPNIDHPANNPAVHAAHAGFLVAHNSLADDPTPENLAIANAQWSQLNDALTTYVFGGGGGAQEAPAGDSAGQMPGEEVEDEGLEAGGGEQPETPQPPGSAGEEGGEEDGAEEEDDEEDKKKNPFKKSESFPFTFREAGASVRTNAQQRGVRGMNSPDFQRAYVDYDSEDETPWHINTGETKLSPSFSTKEEAEHALSAWSSQSQQAMEMDGEEEYYTQSLLKNPDGDTEVSSGSVMGGQEQDFEKPYIGGGNFGGSYNESIPSGRPASLLELLYESKEQNGNGTQYLSESGQRQLVPQQPVSGQGQGENPFKNLRETACPLCCGQGCAACEHEGAVSYQEAAAMEDAVEQYGREHGNNLTWFGAVPDRAFQGNYRPNPAAAKDPMIAAYDRIHQARSRR